jgi:uncharacterized protein (TIGR00255 family)
MTGYGLAVCDLADKSVTVEIRSLNSKQLDLYLRVPSVYRDKEMDVRNILNTRLKRGKAELTINVEYKEGKPPVKLNAPIIKAYCEQLRQIAHDLELDDEPLLQVALRLPESVNGDRQQDETGEWDKVLESLIKSADELDRFRTTEGKAISDDMLKRISIIESLLENISPLESKRIDYQAQRLRSLLAEYGQPDKTDQNRFEQELIYYLEKLDITEEKTRLKQHCGYFRQVINEEEQSGRKLGVISKEIVSEINTIGSKSNDAEIQKLVVLMNDAVQKI